MTGKTRQCTRRPYRAPARAMRPVPGAVTSESMLLSSLYALAPPLKVSPCVFCLVRTSSRTPSCMRTTRESPLPRVEMVAVYGLKSHAAKAMSVM